MAEILGLTASLIGIANLGVSLTRTLYDFATTASNAREEIDYISNNVSDYADILELLVEQLEHDRPIHSKKAVRLAERLYDRSYQLFGRIRDLIPDRRRTRDHISFLERISWNFKKTRVNHLVGELECLKRTVQLLVQVLCTARQFQAYRDYTGKTEERQKKQETAHRQFLRAENVIVEWQRATEKLPSLREASEHEDRLQIQTGSAPTDVKEPSTSEETGSLIKVQGNTLAVIEAATVGATRSESEKRALVLQNTTSWLEQLLDEWTVLALEQEIDRLSDEQGSYRRASRYSSVPAAKAGGMDETTGGPHSPSSERASTRYATGGGEKMSMNIGRSPSLRKSSVEQSHGEHTPRRNQDFPQQPEDSNGMFQRAKVSSDESHSSRPLRTPIDASLQPTLNVSQTWHAPKGYQGLEDSGDGDSNDDNLSVLTQYDGVYGSRKSKFQDGTPFSIALKRRSESKEQREIDSLRTILNGLVSSYREAGPHSRTEYLKLEEEILTQVILKADNLQLSEPEARLNRRELIGQTDGHLWQLDPRNSEKSDYKARR